MQSDSKVEFTPPKDFTIPEGNADGSDFDCVCSFRMKGSQLCMTKLGDVDMPGYGNGEDSMPQQSKPDYSQYAQGMQSQMNGGQQ